MNDSCSVYKPWLNRARADLEASKRIYHTKDYALATYLLEQSCEKAVKALALCSGLYNVQQIAKDYSHNSIGLYLDLLDRLLQIPVMAELLRLNSDVAIFPGLTGKDPSMARGKIEEISTHVPKRSSGKIDEAFLNDFRTVPTKVLRPLIKPWAKLVGRIDLLMPLLRLGDYAAAGNGNNAMKSWGKSGYFGGIGEILSRTEEYIKTLDIKKKPELGNKKDTEGLSFLFPFAVSFLMLLYLSSLTFPHADTSRYPSVAGTSGIADYTMSLGVVGEARALHKIMKFILEHFDVMADSFTALFKLTEIRPFSQKGVAS